MTPWLLKCWAIQLARYGALATYGSKLALLYRDSRLNGRGNFRRTHPKVAPNYSAQFVEMARPFVLTEADYRRSARSTALKREIQLDAIWDTIAFARHGLSERDIEHIPNVIV